MITNSEPQGMEYVLNGQTITRAPEHPGYTELGSWDEPGEDMTFAVDGVPVGGTSWCPNTTRPDGQRWDSWGPAGCSRHHRTREAAEQAQIKVYLAHRAAHCPDCKGSWREGSHAWSARTAQRAYFAAAQATGRHWRRLRRCTNPLDRWTALVNLANLEDTMAQALLTWDNDRTDTRGFTPSEWTAASTRLLRLVMYTERDLLYTEQDLLRSQAPNPVRESEQAAVSGWAQQVLARLSTEAEPGVRAQLVSELWDAVYGDVGGQAAEVLACVQAAYLVLQARVDGARWWRPWTWRRLRQARRQPWMCDRDRGGAAAAARTGRQPAGTAGRSRTARKEHMITESRRADGNPETAADQRFFALRDSGYTGPINQDGHAVTSGEDARILRDMAANRGEDTSWWAGD